MVSIQNVVASSILKAHLIDVSIIEAQVPLAELYKYATDLRSATQGRGSYTMEFSHYEEVPAKISEQIIAENNK